MSGTVTTTQWPGQYAGIEVKGPFSMMNKVFRISPGESAKVVRDWSRDDRCLIKLPPILGNHTVVMYKSSKPTKDFKGCRKYGGTAVKLYKRDLLIPQLHDHHTAPLQSSFAYQIHARCRRLPLGHSRALNAIFVEKYFDFGSKMNVLDLNTPSGCSGHPENTHRSQDIDLCYYTRDGENLTEYFGQRFINTLYTDARLDPEKFHTEHNHSLWLRISQVFPDASFRVDERIYREIISTYGRQFNLQADHQGAYGHDSHLHVSLGKKINWAALCEQGDV